MSDTAPSHLKRDGSDFWQAIAQGTELTPLQEYLLTVAAEQVDLQEKCRKRIEKLGPTLTSKTGVVKPRPELAIERSATRLVQSLIRQFNALSDPGHVNRGRVVSNRGRYARRKKPEGD